MKILFFCAVSFDWDNMTHIPESILKWNSCHTIDFFKFRKIISEVAVQSWKATGADVYIKPTTWWNESVGRSFHDTLDLTEEQLDLISQYDYVIPVDDDDLFAPDFISSINKAERNNVLVWDCLLFQLMGGNLQTFTSHAWTLPHTNPVPYFNNDIGHWRADNVHGWWELASSTYGVRTKWLLKDRKRNVCFFSHHLGTDVFAEGGCRHKGHFPNITELHECLGCKIMHGANVSVLNLHTPHQPIYNLDEQWRPHWPKVFLEYYKIIQNNINKLLETHEIMYRVSS